MTNKQIKENLKEDGILVQFAWKHKGKLWGNYVTLKTTGKTHEAIRLYMENLFKTVAQNATMTIQKHKLGKTEIEMKFEKAKKQLTKRGGLKN